MTAGTIQNRVADRLNLTSSSATTRILASINEKYREALSSIGLATSERGTTQSTVIAGNRSVIFANPQITLTAQAFLPASVTTPKLGALGTMLIPAIGSSIVFDTSKAAGTSANVSTFTTSYTVGGSANFLLVGVIADATTDLVTGVTYNGVAMTQLGKALVGPNWLYWFALTSPATGAHNVVITASASCSLLGCEIASYQNVTPSYYQVVTSQGATAGSSISVTNGGPIAGSWAVMFGTSNLGVTLYQATSVGGATVANLRNNETAGFLIDSGVISGGVEKLLSVYDTRYSPPLVLTEVSFDQIRNEPLITDPAIEYAIQTSDSAAVTIILDSTVTTSYTLFADALINIVDMTASSVPVFPEDFHNMLIYGAMAIELEKLEKYDYAKKQEDKFQSRLSELRYYIAKSAYLDIIPGQNQQLTVSRNVPLV